MRHKLRKLDDSVAVAIALVKRIHHGKGEDAMAVMAFEGGLA
jgi:hypothetical protein